MKTRIAILLSLTCICLPIKADMKTAQRDTAKTEIAGAGPCTNFPVRFQSLETRLAWFYGCMHEDPPTLAQTNAKIAALPLERQKPLIGMNDINREATYGVAFGELPIQIFPK